MVLESHPLWLGWKCSHPIDSRNLNSSPVFTSLITDRDDAVGFWGNRSSCAPHREYSVVFGSLKQQSALLCVMTRLCFLQTSAA